MSLRWLLASFHLLALGIGLGAVWMRARGLARVDQYPTRLEGIFKADALWGVAAVVWISTGLLRAFGGFEKGAGYYLANPAFHIKMGLLLIILALEAWPMATLIHWRIARGRGGRIELGRARLFARISYVQAGLVVAMVLAAVAMGRGF